MAIAVDLSCAPCLLASADNPAVTVLHGSAMCDLHVRLTGQRIAAAMAREDREDKAVDRGTGEIIALAVRGVRP